MSYSALSIANFFLNKGDSERIEISPMKLQKLVYYAHGWYLGNTGEPLIDEVVEAWPYGPVIPTLYHEFKRFGGSSIKDRATELTDDFELVEVREPQDSSIRTFLESIWLAYSKYTGEHLSNMTHSPGTPWSKTWERSGRIRGTDISNQEMAVYFRDLIAKSKAVSSDAKV